MADQRLRLLIVEDDEDDYTITRDLLAEAYGAAFDLEWVASYQGAVDAIESQSYDAYLFDYLLGAHTGLDLLNKVLEHNQAAPVILLTGQGDHDIDLEAMRSGAASYLVKGQLSAPLLERTIRYAIERSKMLKALQDLATRDELTGLHNRREMNRILQEEVSRYHRYGKPVSLLMLDIDHFKAVNDTHGHQAGDEVLRRVADAVARYVRSIDKVARFGGVELAVIMPESDAAEALQAAERLREQITATPMMVAQADGEEKSLQIHITISVGVSAIPGDATTVESLIETADRALYEAKRRGRNCCVPYAQLDPKQAARR